MGDDVLLGVESDLEWCRARAMMIIGDTSPDTVLRLLQQVRLERDRASKRRDTAIRKPAEQRQADDDEPAEMARKHGF